jgi:hypothetical protein
MSNTRSEARLATAIGTLRRPREVEVTGTVPSGCSPREKVAAVVDQLPSSGIEVLWPFGAPLRLGRWVEFGALGDLVEGGELLRVRFDEGTCPVGPGSALVAVDVAGDLGFVFGGESGASSESFTSGLGGMSRGAKCAQPV